MIRRSSRSVGMVLIYAIAMMIVLIGLTSLAVDWGRVQMVKTQLQRSADAAARAACSGMKTDIPTAQSWAVQFGGLNKADGTSVVIDPNNDVEFGTWYSPSGAFTKLIGSARSSANAVRVTARRTSARGNALSIPFAAVLGQSTCNVNGIAIAYRRSCLFIVGSLPLIASDQPQYDRLVNLGFIVQSKTDAACSAADANGQALVFISESATSSTLGGKLSNVNVPVVCCEGNSFGFMKMTGPANFGSDCNDYANVTQVTLQNTVHPLAAGLIGTQLVYPDGWGEMNVGFTTTAAAVNVGYVSGYPGWWVIFGYDAGAAMYGGYIAPQRRVGLFIRQPSLSHTTNEAWLFFDAAVKWAAGDL